MEALSKHLVEIFFGLVSAGALAFCKHLWSKNKKLEEMQQADQNRLYRQMVLDEIEPLLDEIESLKNDIVKIKQSIQDEVTHAKSEVSEKHHVMYEDLERVEEEIKRNFTLIVNSYKYRLIQLCKSHLKDGFITEEDFEQITELYKLFCGLNGNLNRVQEFYEKVLELEIRHE